MPSRRWLTVVKVVVLLLSLSVLVAGCRGGSGGSGLAALTFSGEQRLGRPEGSASSPLLRAGPDGQLYVVWTEKDPSAEAAAGGAAPSSSGHAGHGGGTTGTAAASPAPALRTALLSVSSDGGRTWSEPVRVNDKPEDVQGDENLPKLALGAGGQVYAAWSIPSEKGDRMRANIRFAWRAPGGKAFSAARTLNEVKDAARFVALETAPDGTAFAAWIDRRQDNPAPRQLYMTRISTTGTVMTTNYQIGEASCECCRITMAIDRGGKNVYLAYRQKAADNLRNMVMIKSTDGGATFGEPVVISDDGWKVPACPHSGPVLAADAKGNLHVIWYTYGRTPQESGVYYTVSRDGGRTFAPRRLIHAAGRPEILNPYLAIGERGDVFMAWSNFPAGSDQTQVFFRHLAADGRTLSPVQQISRAEGSAARPSLAVSKDGVHVAWTETKGSQSWVVTAAASVPR